MTLTEWPCSTAAPARPVPAIESDVAGYLPSLDELARRWHEIEPLLAKATVRTGCYEPIDLLLLAGAGRAGIWLCTHQGHLDAALCTQIVAYPRKRVLEVMFGGGGNLWRWRRQLVETIDRHAREHGCSHVATCGRPAWLRAWGAKATGDIVMVRDI